MDNLDNEELQSAITETASLIHGLPDHGQYCGPSQALANHLHTLLMEQAIRAVPLRDQQQEH